MFSCRNKQIPNVSGLPQHILLFFFFFYPCRSIWVSKGSPAPNPLHLGIQAEKIMSILDVLASRHQTEQKRHLGKAVQQSPVRALKASGGGTQLRLIRHRQGTWHAAKPDADVGRIILLQTGVNKMIVLETTAIFKNYITRLLNRTFRN